MDELGDVLCPSDAYVMVLWCFLDLNQFTRNWSRTVDKKFDILLTQIQVNSF